MRHLTRHSEASKPAQIDTEPSLFIFQTSPSSPIPAFLASGPLWQGVYPKLEGEKELSRKMSKFIYHGQKTLKMPTVGRATWKSGACAIISVYTRLLMLPLWAPLLPPEENHLPMFSSTVSSCCDYVQLLWGSGRAAEGEKAVQDRDGGHLDVVRYRFYLPCTNCVTRGPDLLFKIQSAKKNNRKGVSPFWLCGELCNTVFYRECLEYL